MTAWLNPVWHSMLYSCTRMATVGVKGLTTLAATFYSFDEFSHHNNKLCLYIILMLHVTWWLFFLINLRPTRWVWWTDTSIPQLPFVSVYLSQQ